MDVARVIVYILAAAASLAAANEDLAILARAVSDYEKVALAARPDLKSAMSCVQSQAALAPALEPDRQYLAHFRKGLCELAAGKLRNSEAGYRDAVSDFKQAIAKWPAVSTTGNEVASSVRVALAIARAHLGELDSARQDFAAILLRPNCPGTLLMPASGCGRYLDAARLWLGWIQFENGNLREAESLLRDIPESALKHRVAGLWALKFNQFDQAAPHFLRALAAPPPASVLGLLSPPVNRTDIHFELGFARLHGGMPAEAVESFDAVVKAKPNNARAIFLRGRAREMLDRTKEALADYELASRTAFANVGEPFESGHAHYYRGVLLFRRKDFSRAESEFASALNFETAESMKTDVEAWRHMAAVASGGCAASAGMLEQTLPGTSRLFPRDEARQLLNSCRS